MPAIRREKLKQDAEAVVAEISNPHLFIRQLEGYFTVYADRTKRSGQAVTPPPLIPAFNSPTPVEREILRAISGKLQGSFEDGLLISDMLWQRDYFEIKKIAICILGTLAPEDPNQILERTKEWPENNKEERLFDLLFETGAKWIRENHSGLWLDTIRKWLKSDQNEYQNLGLRALIPTIRDPSFDDLPAIFQMLTPLSYTIPPKSKVFFRDACMALAIKSPFETAYFLEACLENSTDATMGWVSRRVMDSLPVNTRQKVKDAAKHSR